MNHQNSKCTHIQKIKNLFTFKNILETILNNSLTCRWKRNKLKKKKNEKKKIYIYTVPTSRKLRLSRLFNTSFTNNVSAVQIVFCRCIHEIIDQDQ